MKLQPYPTRFSVGVSIAGISLAILFLILRLSGILATDHIGLPAFIIVTILAGGIFLGLIDFRTAATKKYFRKRRIKNRIKELSKTDIDYLLSFWRHNGRHYDDPLYTPTAQRSVCYILLSWRGTKQLGIKFKIKKETEEVLEETYQRNVEDLKEDTHGYSYERLF